MAEKDVISTDRAPGPFQGAPYNQAIVANGFVYVAGQLGLTPDGTMVEGGIGRASCRERVFITV